MLNRRQHGGSRVGSVAATAARDGRNAMRRSRAVVLFVSDRDAATKRLRLERRRR